LTWSSTNGTTVTVDQGIGTVAATGTRSVNPTATTTYIITGTNNTGTATQSVTLTVNPAADTTLPTVSISSPIANATLSESVAITANAADNIGVAGVQFKIDGVNFGAEDTIAPFSTTWNTTTISNGSHAINAVARDAAGNTATTLVSIVVFNSAPITTFTRTITIASLEGRTNKIITGTINVLDNSKVLIKSYPFTTNSSGSTTITFDIPAQTVFLQIKVIPFLTRLISVDLNSNVTYTFPAPQTGDINGDNIVNSIDFSALNAKWFTTDAAADLNQDGIVNGVDFSLLNKNWFVNGEK
jgi:hypothetical protein